jgi:hypothetical protein
MITAARPSHVNQRAQAGTPRRSCGRVRAIGSIRVKSTLVARGPAAAIVLGDDQVAAIGEGARRFPVLAAVNGYEWRTTVTRMRGEFVLGFSRAVRDGARVETGDTIEVEITLDRAAREVDVPAALTEALVGDPQARAAFDRLAYTHRKEYARWIDEAKRPETRARRIIQALEMLRQGKTRS